MTKDKIKNLYNSIWKNKKLHRGSAALNWILAASILGTGYYIKVSEEEKIKPLEFTKPGLERQILCMAKNIYHEARGESLKGQKAVFHVTFNRTKSKHYPKSICEVVYQYKQFSWTLDAKKRTSIPSNDPKFKEIMNNVVLWIEQDIPSPVGKSTHYHANYVKPYWKSDMKHHKTIDNHIFYNMKVK